MFVKSTPPRARPTGGMMTSVTSELTMVPKAAPMMMPTAMSRTLPRMANSLNSLNICGPPDGRRWPARGACITSRRDRERRGRPWYHPPRRATRGLLEQIYEPSLDDGRPRGHGGRGSAADGRRRPATAQRRSLRPRHVHGAGDCGAAGAALRPRARARRHGAARTVVRQPRGAVRPRRRDARRGVVRRAVSGLQLDGPSGPRRLRRLLGGHDRLWPFDAAVPDERPVQPRGRSAGRVHRRRARRAIRAT